MCPSARGKCVPTATDTSRAQLFRERLSSRRAETGPRGARRRPFLFSDRACPFLRQNPQLRGTQLDHVSEQPHGGLGTWSHPFAKASHRFAATTRPVTSNSRPTCSRTVQQTCLKLEFSPSTKTRKVSFRNQLQAGLSPRAPVHRHTEGICAAESGARLEMTVHGNGLK